MEEIVSGAVTPGADLTVNAAAGLSGTVVPAAERRGVPNATIVVFDPRSGEEITETGGDALGRYRLNSVAPGICVVCFFAQDLGAQCWKRVPWTDGVPVDRATHVRAGAGRVRSSRMPTPR